MSLPKRKIPEKKPEEKAAYLLLRLLRRRPVSSTLVRRILLPAHGKELFHSSQCTGNITGRDCWIRAVEILYAWFAPENAISYLEQKGRYRRYVWYPHNAQSVRNSIESPLRRDLKKALGAAAESMLHDLERVTPTKAIDLPGAVLARDLRQYAIRQSHSHKPTYLSISIASLADFILDDANWRVLCLEYALVSEIYYFTFRGGFTMAPRVPFFRTPSESEVRTWKAGGWLTYLQSIATNVAKHITYIYEDIGILQNPRAMGALGTAYAAAITKEAKSKLFRYRNAWHSLLKKMHKDDILKNQIMISRDRTGKTTFIKELWGDISDLTSLPGWKEVTD